MIPNTETITILQTLMIHYQKLPESYAYQYMAEIYDGGTRLYAIVGESQSEVHKDIINWVYENFDVPMNLETSNLMYHQAEEIW